MTQEHPITPPRELVQEWIKKYGNSEDPRWQSYEQDIATQAARWGADKELEACRLWVSEAHSIYDATELLNQRRPKPPSLKQQALSELDSLENMGACNADTIRRALEALPDE